MASASAATTRRSSSRAMPGEKRRARLRAVVKTAGGGGVDGQLIEQAFVHESASREGAGPSNERLEFLGDALLGYIAARWLVQKYPDATEGELARRRAALGGGGGGGTTAGRA